MMSFSDVQAVDIFFFFFLSYFAEDKKEHLAAYN